jgi:ATP-dependent DNA ligase
MRPQQITTQALDRLNPDLYRFEPKINGKRTIIYWNNAGKLELWTRHATLHRTTHIQNLIMDLTQYNFQDLLLDAEILMNKGEQQLFIFDLINLLDAPLENRLDTLYKLGIKSTKYIHFIDQFNYIPPSQRFTYATQTLKVEGLVLKKLNSLYYQGDNINWLKVKE